MFNNFTYVIVAAYFTNFESLVLYRNTRSYVSIRVFGCRVREPRAVTSVKVNGCDGAIPT